MRDPSLFAPMLSAKIDTSDQSSVDRDLSKLSYPLIGSPKVDGIRVLIHPNLGPVTRKLKTVPNKFIYTSLYTSELYGLDGEIIVGNDTEEQVFNSSQSGVMTQDGQPNFTYLVFDSFTHPTLTYRARMAEASHRVAESAELGFKHIQLLPWAELTSPKEVLEYEEVCLSKGYEGVMLRHPNQVYKHNRSTLKQQHLIKLKRTADAEATIVGFEPRYRNKNEATRDNLGYARHSDHKAGMVAEETLGAFLCAPDPSSGFTAEFSIGSGLDDNLRNDFWGRRDELLGKHVSFKYQACGSLDRPRFPIFKGLRGDC